MALGGLILAVYFAVVMGSDLCAAAQQWMWAAKVLGGCGILALAGLVLRWIPGFAADVFGLAVLLMAGVMGPTLIIWGLIQACI